jgi:glycolate oxidase
MRACVAVGGSLSGEHGIGLEKRAAMDLVFSQSDLEVMDTVRGALDPERRFNPGKVIPAHGCREVRTRAPDGPPGQDRR